MVTLQVVGTRKATQRMSKWIDGLEAEMPVVEAAEKTLRRRLDAVWKLLPAAARRSYSTVEHVHQLRVATRRAMAALQGYAELLPPRKAEKMQKHLRKIRRCAGEARDFDVLLDRLRRRDDRETMEPLIDRIGDLREEAQEPIVAAYRKLQKKDFRRKIKRLVNKIHEPLDRRHSTFCDWAKLGLARDLEAFCTAGAADLNHLPTLHQFRIEGKLLRYAMEYYSDAFDGRLREHLYPELERLQGVLGIVNDHASAVEKFEHWLSAWDVDELRPLLETLLAEERAALQAARHEYFRWWTPQRSADFIHGFNDFLQLPEQGEVA